MKPTPCGCRGVLQCNEGLANRRPFLEQVLLVTGASRGIGAATAKLAAQRGYAVAVNYAGNRAAADSVVQAIREAGGKAIAIQADVAHEDQVLAMFERVDDELGPLTALVNNAGVIDVT